MILCIIDFIAVENFGFKYRRRANAKYTVDGFLFVYHLEYQKK